MPRPEIDGSWKCLAELAGATRDREESGQVLPVSIAAHTPGRRRPFDRHGVYGRVYQLVAQIPPGRVATYGQLAAMAGRCSPRMVGYAMAAVPAELDLPWHRVLNARGEVSIRADGSPSHEQRKRLQAEGVAFDARGRIAFAVVGWPGPDWRWLAQHGFQSAPPAGIKA